MSAYLKLLNLVIIGIVVIVFVIIADRFIQRWNDVSDKKDRN